MKYNVCKIIHKTYQMFVVVGDCRRCAITNAAHSEEAHSQISKMQRQLVQKGVCMGT